MERTEIVSLYKNTPADGTVVTVCGWAKNIRDSKNIGFIALSDGGCFKTLQIVLEAGKLANYDEPTHAGSEGKQALIEHPTLQFTFRLEKTMCQSSSRIAFATDPGAKNS